MGLIKLLKKDYVRIRSLFLALEGTDPPQELQDYFNKLANILTIYAEAVSLQVIYHTSRISS